jgi:hypothetical protein
MSRRSLGTIALAAGLLVVVASQRLAPVAGPPLYDGVIVEAPYRWLSPPAGHTGGAQGTAQPVPIQGNQNPDLGIGTNENPPQAQVFAGAGFLNMPPGTTSITVSIQPLPPPAQPASGVIAGNVYEVSLTNQNGQPVTGQASGGVTIELRGPPTLSSVKIERFANNTWTPIGGDSVGQPNMYTAQVTDFGDFAIVAPDGWTPAPDGGGGGGPVGPQAPGGAGASTPASQGSGSSASSSSPDPTLLVVGGVVGLLVLLVAIGLLLYARRARRVAPGPRPTLRRSSRPREDERPRAPSRPSPVPRKHRRRGGS